VHHQDAQNVLLLTLMLLLPVPSMLSATDFYHPPGAILVNPWNINDVAAAIEDALTMSEEERRERHRQNYMHVATHTAQVRQARGLSGNQHHLHS
jgi:hypothetical protein